MTITSIPADMLSMVEGMAAKFADGIQAGGDANPASILSNMSGLFGMLGVGGDPPPPPKKGKGKLKELM
jgi:hypothetical protein